jgi:hypothetical protein
MSYVTAKLARMRKAQEFSVMPVEDGEELIVQSDKSIGRFNFRTGAGVLNTKGAYFPHLSKFLGAEPFTFPAEFVAECLQACPSLDGQTVYGGGAFIIEHTVREF